MADDLRVNGNLVSWGSYILKINNERYSGVSSIGYDQKRERSKGSGMGKAQRPRGRTRGKYTPPVVKLTLAKDTAIKLRKDLAALASDGKSYGNAEVPIFLQVVEGDITSTVEFERACVTSESATADDSADPSSEDWEFDTMGMSVDGLTLYDSSEG